MSTQIHHYKKSEQNEHGKRGLEIKTDLKPKLQKGLFRWSWILFGLIVLVVLFFSSWVNFQDRPVLTDSGKFDYFEISPGASSREIASELERKGFIRNQYAFWIMAKTSRKSLQSGLYKLSGSIQTSEILKKIQDGQTDAFSVTIPEGYRVLQVAKLLEEKANIDSEKFIEAATGKEGTLFPDTYMFPSNYEPSKVVRKMQENYDSKVAKLNLTQEQLILASVVEREAKKDDERAKIAAVYRNRADNNMLLQADPTIRYALDSQTYLKSKSVDFTFWTGISRSDYQNLTSPFNSYKQKGYPPAPICNPGIKSIEAAITSAPDFGDYYYFFHDKNLEIHFSKTLQEHQEAIRQFGLPGL